MTPSFIGRIATMLPGVRPSMSLASFPTASTSLVTLFIATMEGSLTTMPRPFAYTRVFAVPRSMARSLENRLKTRLRFMNLLQLLFHLPKGLDHNGKDTRNVQQNSFSATIWGLFEGLYERLRMQAR